MICCCILYFFLLFFFFFKQKTAYEMRISDWSSDVCSSDLTPRLVKELNRMALEYNINIVGGSHPTRTDDGDIQNVAYVCLRDGSTHARAKIHPTPNARYWWNIKGGEEVDVIQTDCGPVGVLIRSAERRGGKGWCRKCRTRWSPEQ